jgi:hypothetical protein
LRLPWFPGVLTLSRSQRLVAVTCAGPFARNSSHEKLVSAFGAGNVTFREIANVEGDRIPASVVFPDDPSRRLSIIWMNSEARRELSAIWIDGESQWAGIGSIRLGMSIDQVEALNRKPFKLTGFGWDYGGTVTDWKGGAMARLSGGCRMSLRFTPKPERLEDDYIEGEQQFPSDEPGIRASRAVVTRIFISYPK